MSRSTDEQALRELQDRTEITELLFRNARGLDQVPPDFDAVSSCFSDDARWDYGPGAGPVVIGAANINAFIRQAYSQHKVQEGGVQVRIRGTSHHVTNIMIDFESDDEARSEAYVFTWHEMADGSPGLVWGRWRDRIRRTADGWKIASRKMMVAATENYYAIGYPLHEDGDDA
jgi:hypothetical protein